MSAAFQPVARHPLHWLDALPRRWPECTVLPWNAIERLRDHFGDYVLVVTCRRCRHSRDLLPATLAHSSPQGWDEPIAAVVARLRCRCGAREVDVQLGFNRKPRGWSKNPS
jgi:hypothetical protein